MTHECPSRCGAICTVGAYHNCPVERAARERQEFWERVRERRKWNDWERGMCIGVKL